MKQIRCENCNRIIVAKGELPLKAIIECNKCGVSNDLSKRDKPFSEKQPMIKKEAQWFMANEDRLSLGFD